MKHPAAELDDVSRETRERLDCFVELLGRWSERLNLVANAGSEHVWQRHILDSLQLVPLIPPGTTRAIDLGSGAGFPGLVLAIATGVNFDLVESDKRKAAFLREAARITSAPARVHAVRIEAAHLVPGQLITARALAPLPKLLALATPLLAPGGEMLFPKGRGLDAELTQALSEWQMEFRVLPSRTDPLASILQIRDPRRVPEK